MSIKKHNLVSEQTTRLVDNLYTSKSTLNFYSWNTRNRYKHHPLLQIGTFRKPIIADDKYYRYFVSSVTYDIFKINDTHAKSENKFKHFSSDKNIVGSLLHIDLNNILNQDSYNAKKILKQNIIPLISVLETSQLNKFPNPVTPIISAYTLIIERWVTNSELFVLDIDTIKSKIVAQVYKIVSIITDRYAKEKIVDTTDTVLLMGGFEQSRQDMRNSNVGIKPSPSIVNQYDINLNYYKDITESITYNSELKTNQVVYVRPDYLLSNFLHYLKKWSTLLETQLHYAFQVKHTVFKLDYSCSN